MLGTQNVLNPQKRTVACRKSRRETALKMDSEIIQDINEDDYIGDYSEDDLFGVWLSVYFIKNYCVKFDWNYKICNK